MKKKRIILFLKSSIGELNVALPMIYFLKQKMQDDVEVIFASSSKSILDDLKLPKEYLFRIKELGKLYFGKKELLVLIKRTICDKSSTLIMTCDSGAGPFERFFYTFLQKSHIVHFHHAFALHRPLPASSEEITKINPNKRYVQNSSILLNSENDRVWLESLGFGKEKIFYIGALGYSQDWLENTSGLKINKSKQNKLSIFMPLRDIHPLYLTKSNHDYLIDSLVTLFKKFSDYNFIVKFHPRQKNQQEINRKLADLNNVKQVDNLSTLQLAAKADLTISFWSSAITDSLAVMTPVIEFHRHEVLHSQIIEQDGQLVSVYNKIGFCKYLDNKEELLEFLNKQTKETLAELLIKQRKSFDDIFGLEPDIFYRLENAFIENFKIAQRRNFFEINRFLVLSKIFFSILIGKIKKMNLKIKLS